MLHSPFFAVLKPCALWLGLHREGHRTGTGCCFRSRSASPPSAVRVSVTPGSAAVPLFLLPLCIPGTVREEPSPGHLLLVPVQAPDSEEQRHHAEGRDQETHHESQRHL